MATLIFGIGALIASLYDFPTFYARIINSIFIMFVGADFYFLSKDPEDAARIG